jgi:hypothetical protein
MKPFSVLRSCRREGGWQHAPVGSVCWFSKKQGASHALAVQAWLQHFWGPGERAINLLQQNVHACYAAKMYKISSTCHAYWFCCSAGLLGELLLCGCTCTIINLSLLCALTIFAAASSSLRKRHQAI